MMNKKKLLNKDMFLEEKVYRKKRISEMVGFVNPKRFQFV